MTRTEKLLLRSALGLVLVGTLAGMASLESLSHTRQADARPVLVVGQADPQVRSCRAMIGDQMVQVPVGQSVQVGGRWGSCDLYDGHPVMVHSAEAPRSAL